MSQPAYDDPPVAEVALAIHFSPLGALKAVHLGRLATLWEESYPYVEEHPEAPPAPDELDRPTGLPSFRIELVENSPLPRTWYRNESGSRLIQIQRDRVVHNWRRLSEDDPYPRYTALRPLFENAYDQFSGLVEAQGIGKLHPTQCEVTYVNPVVVGGHITALSDLGKLIAPWSGEFSDDFLPQPEGVALDLQFAITGDDGKQLGRLHISVAPAVHGATGQEVMLLQLVARGRPLSPSREGALAFLDVAHDWIVRGFASVTTPEIQSQWRRTDA